MTLSNPYQKMSSPKVAPSNEKSTAATALPNRSDNDYATRYEALLLEQRNLHSLLQSSMSSSSSSSSSSFPSKTNIATAMLTNNASMSIMLQSEIQSLQKKQKEDHQGRTASTSTSTSTSRNNKKDKEEESMKGLICLWRQTLHNQQYGQWYEKLDEQNQGQAKTQADSIANAGRTYSLTGIENEEQKFANKTYLHDYYCINNNTSSSNNNNGNGKANEEQCKMNQNELDDEIDAFFEDYPECKSNDTSYSIEVPVESSSSTSSSSNSNKRRLPNNRNKINSSIPVTVLSSTANTSTASSSSAIRNPYMNNSSVQKNLNQQQQQQQSMANNTTSVSSSSSSWDVYNARNSQRYTSLGGINEEETPDTNNYGHYNTINSQSNHRQKQPQQSQPQILHPSQQKQKSNPFCTAKELKQKEPQSHNDNDDMMDDEIENQNYNQSESDEQVVMYPNMNPNNPYLMQQQQQQQQLQQQAGLNLNRPNLSVGLKRKFQTPKLGLGNTAKTSSKSSSTTSNYNGNRGGGQIPKSNNNQSKDDGDELPEQLKGLDKELITKIENEIVDSGDTITFNEIAGLEHAKQTVMELVCWPMKRPDLFTGLRRGPNGLLLFGPPGTGKTLIGKAIAYESGATFFSISSSSLTSKWIGEGEKLVKTLFAVAAYREPSVVFIDEIDSLLTQRKADENEASRRIKTEFLVQLDGTGTSGQGRVLAIGATNRPNELDDAARRRFVKRLYIPLPEELDRVILLRTLLTKNTHALTEKEILKVSTDTDGFSGADLKALCTDAALGPLRDLGNTALNVAAADIPPISYRHFRRAIKHMNPSVAQADLDLYTTWNATYGSKSLCGEENDDLSDDDEESV